MINQNKDKFFFRLQSSGVQTQHFPGIIHCAGKSNCVFFPLLHWKQFEENSHKLQQHVRWTSYRPVRDVSWSMKKRIVSWISHWDWIRQHFLLVLCCVAPSRFCSEEESCFKDQSKKTLVLVSSRETAALLPHWENGNGTNEQYLCFCVWKMYCMKYVLYKCRIASFNLACFLCFYYFKAQLEQQEIKRKKTWDHYRSYKLSSETQRLNKIWVNLFK